jgi:hypothetical protein
MCGRELHIKEGQHTFLEVLETGLFPSLTSSSFEGALDVLEGLVR